MKRRLIPVLFCCAPLMYGAQPSRVPVLVELFTSEGCSSCPPADRVLEQLDPRAIVLSEHVDYWDHDGWKDPNSSPTFTRRQEHYTRQLSVDGPYTPEMIVDGAAEFNGSNGPRALSEIEKAVGHKKAAVHLARTPAGIQIDIDEAPRASSVFLVFAENSTASQVAAGENKGRKLQHVAVVRSIRKIGNVKHNEPFHKLVEVTPDDRGRRVVVFLQDSDLGPVSGAAVLEP